jgi:hypothetical protein
MATAANSQLSNNEGRTPDVGIRPLLVVALMTRSDAALNYGVTWPTNVPQLASEVRGAFGMYSQENQTLPFSSATAAE